MNTKQKNQFKAIGAGSILSLLSYSTLALQSDSDDINNAEAINEIEIVTVTAGKQGESLKSVPASVGVISELTLNEINHQHINQAISQVAGGWVSRGNGQEHLTAIRSPVLTGAGGCGAFFMAADGISLRAPGFCNANQLFDANSEQAARIEVLRGPASTLYGSNALHGVINIISPDILSNQYGSLSAELGANDFARTQLAVTKDLDSDSSIGLFTNLTSEGGFQADSGYDQQKLTLVYQTKEIDSLSNGKNVWSNKTVVDVSNLNQETAGFVQGFEVFKDDQLRRENPNPEAFRDAKSLRAYSKFSSSLAQGLVSITPYVRWNEMAFLQHFLPWQALEENAHSSVGVQAQYEFTQDSVSWIVGADVDFTQGELQETQERDFSPSIPAGDHYDYEVDASTVAAYAQANWQLGDLSIIAGARAERVNYDYDNLLGDGSACADDVALCRFSRPEDQSLSFTTISPSLTLNYSLYDDQLVYAKLNQGFRAPQATELFRLQNNQTTAQLDTETMDAVELGYRHFSDTHSFRAAAFVQQKKDVIIQDTNRQNIIGGETSHQGIELEYSLAIQDNLSLATNYSYAEHTYDSNFTFSRVDIKGNEIDTAPNHLLGGRISWQASEKLDTSLYLTHISEYFLNPENTATYDGHTLLDLYVGFQLSPKVSVQANVYNILDTDYAERADFGFGNFRYFVGQPRRVFVSLNWDFAG